MNYNKVRHFNVLCVTKRNHVETYQKPIKWHEPITGIATVTSSNGSDPLFFNNATVEFQGKSHKVLGVRSGLDESALTIKVQMDDEYDIWELYTDTPVADRTPKQIREKAQRTIERRQQSNQRAAEIAAQQVSRPLNI